MKVRINKPLSTTQRKTLKQECIKEFDKLLAMYNRQVAIQMMCILHFDYGFGQKRLKQFSDNLEQMRIESIERYEVTDDDIPDICEIQLRNSGIDVKAILGE